MVAKVNIEYSTEEKQLFDNMEELLANVHVQYNCNNIAARHIEIVHQLLDEILNNKIPQTEEEMENFKQFIKGAYGIN